MVKKDIIHEFYMERTYDEISTPADTSIIYEPIDEERFVGILSGKLKFADMITDHATGGTSHTKVWSNVANITGTIAFVWYAYNLKASEELFLIYLGVVGASTVVSKFISLKYGKNRE